MTNGCRDGDWRDTRLWCGLTGSWNFVCKIKFVFNTSLNCRAMLCIPWLLPACGVCLSVRLSVTFVSCAKTNKNIFEIFSSSGSQTILVFQLQTGWRYSDWNSPNGGVECKGYEKIDEFLPIFRSISETVIVRWAHAARQFVSIEFSFYPYNI